MKKPQETVMKGAAIFGLFPNQILYRISPVTIAVNHYIDVKENDDCNDFKDENGNSLCLNYIIFVERGKSVKTNEILRKFNASVNFTCQNCGCSTEDHYLIGNNISSIFSH